MLKEGERYGLNSFQQRIGCLFALIYISSERVLISLRIVIYQLEWKN